MLANFHDSFKVRAFHLGKEALSFGVCTFEELAHFMTVAVRVAVLRRLRAYNHSRKDDDEGEDADVANARKSHLEEVIGMRYAEMRKNIQGMFKYI